MELIKEYLKKQIIYRFTRSFETWVHFGAVRFFSDSGKYVNINTNWYRVEDLETIQ